MNHTEEIQNERKKGTHTEIPKDGKGRTTKLTN